MKFKFKAVEELPGYSRATRKYKEFIEEFLKSGVAIADITEDYKKFNTKPAAFFHGVKYEIFRMGVRNRVFISTRQKRTFIVNVEKSGIRSVSHGRKVNAVGGAGWKRKKVE